MTLMEQAIRSPRLPQIWQELRRLLRLEKRRRQRFIWSLDEERNVEFINGRIVERCPEMLRNIQASDAIFSLLSIYVSRCELGRVLNGKAMISLMRNDYQPDISFFKTAKVTRFKREQIRLPAPELIVEVVSPDTEHIDRTIKFEDYAAHGVDEYWIVDPLTRTLEQFLLVDDGYDLEFKGRTGRMKSRAIRGFEMPVKAAFDAKENFRVLKEIVGKGT